MLETQYVILWIAVFTPIVTYGLVMGLSKFATTG